MLNTWDMFEHLEQYHKSLSCSTSALRLFRKGSTSGVEKHIQTQTQHKYSTNAVLIFVMYCHSTLSSATTKRSRNVIIIILKLSIPSLIIFSKLGPMLVFLPLTWRLLTSILLKIEQSPGGFLLHCFSLKGPQ